MRISVIIPVYNEEHTIAEIVSRVRAVERETEPSTEKSVKEIFALLSQLIGPVSPAVISAMVLAPAALVVYLSGRAYFLLKGTLSDHPDREKMILFLICPGYALIHPRFKDCA